MVWPPHKDIFHFQLPEFKFRKILTKWSILPNIALVSDGLNLLSPITICGKIFLQQHRETQRSWDDLLPPNITLNGYNLHVT